MLRSLRIQNFRTLSDFRVSSLGRVNLIVGKNNSGKSTVLEALRIYSQNGSPALLDDLLVGHDEVLPSLGQHGSEDKEIPYQNFFSGRVFPGIDDKEIYIGDEPGQNYVKIAHTYYLEERVEPSEDGGFARLKRSPISKLENHEEASEALLISSSRRDQPRWIPISEGMYPGFRRGRPAAPDTQVVPMGFVPTGLLPSANLADLWDTIALTSFDDIVRDGLRIIEPAASGIAFVKREKLVRNESERAAIVKLEGSAKPLPLNSMGDGMVRILQLLLALVPAKGGVYLVDEFENGLHYSIQDKVWELIFTLAAAQDIQVFAATHSWDCIEAFRNVANRLAESAVLFRVGKSVKHSDHGKVIATVFEKDALTNLTQNDVEIR